MQIREMNLKELDSIYKVLVQLRPSLSFKEFDDLVYDMRHMDYKMIGILERGELVTFAGVAVQTNFYHKRHLFIFDLVTDEKYRGKGYEKEMLEYLESYAKTAMCENIVLSSDFDNEDSYEFYEKNSFEKNGFLFLKSL